MPTTFTAEDVDARGLRVGIVVAMFNDQFTSKMLQGAIETAHGMGVADDDIWVYWVPGAFELPVVAQRLAETGQVDAIAAIGCVIRGETPHFDFVAGEASRGLMNVVLDTGIPVGFGLITADDSTQAEARSGGAVGNKGSEAMYAALHSATVLNAIAEEFDDSEDENDSDDQERESRSGAGQVTQR